MSDLKNSEIIKHIMQALVDTAGRRTSEGFAVVILDTVIKQLEPKYDFLKYAKIENTMYSEGIDAINIIPDIDSVKTVEFYKAIGDIIKTTIQHFEKDSDFFFIKEIQETINKVDGLKLEELGIDLDIMQFQHIVEKTQILKENNSEVMEHVLKALVCLLNRKLPGLQAIKTIVVAIKKLEENYDFLKYIEISYRPDPDGFYSIRALSEIDNIWSSVLGEALQRLIEDVGRSVKWDSDQFFIEGFKAELGQEYISKIKTMGVKLDHVQTAIQRRKHDQLVRKTLDALIHVVSSETSESFALSTIDNAIKNLEEKHDVLRYIKIDASRYMDGFDAVSIMSEINNVESYKLGKAIQEIIKMLHNKLGGRVPSFIEDFKNKLGDKYLSEIEKIGVNLHLLQLKSLL